MTEAQRGAVTWALAILESELNSPDDIWADHIRQAADLLRIALDEPEPATVTTTTGADCRERNAQIAEPVRSILNAISPKVGSCRPCGCDPGAGWVCERHQEAQS